MVLEVTVLFLSLAALCKGADYLLEASEKIGVAMGLSPLAVGFFLIAFGTSLPELFVSHSASLRGYPEIALGNIIGSNISNIFLILGVASLWMPLPLAGEEVKEQLVLHGLLCALFVGLLAWGRLDALGSLALLFFFGYSILRTYRKMRGRESADSESISPGVGLLVKFFIGLIFLAAGGDFVVKSASVIALRLEIGEYIVSAVLVALGTSLPELVTVIRACSQKRNAGLIVGNVIGSNIFNVAFVMGSLGIYSIPLSWNFSPEAILLVVISCVFLWLCKLGRNLDRVAGAMLLAGYGGIIVWWLAFSGR